ncbi:MAG: hypothetical protein AAF998_08820 [Bacteroidota bacterium]
MPTAIRAAVGVLWRRSAIEIARDVGERIPFLDVRRSGFRVRANQPVEIAPEREMAQSITPTFGHAVVKGADISGKLTFDLISGFRRDAVGCLNPAVFLLPSYRTVRHSQSVRNVICGTSNPFFSRIMPRLKNLIHGGKDTPPGVKRPRSPTISLILPNWPQKQPAVAPVSGATAG